jgi:hypothetical protein
MQGMSSLNSCPCVWSIAYNVFANVVAPENGTVAGISTMPFYLAPGGELSYTDSLFMDVHN